MHQDHLTPQDARLIMHETESFMERNEVSVDSEEVIALTSSTKRLAYECEFVAIFIRPDLKFYTPFKNSR